MQGLSLWDRLALVPDPRAAGGKRHSLAAVLRLIAAAVVSGLKSLEAIAQFGRSLTPSRQRELGFTHRPLPCKATLSNVLRRLDHEALEDQLRTWAAERAGQPQHVALDGKTARGSSDGEVKAVHLLAAYAVEEGVVLAQTAVGDKTNEHKAALELLKQTPLAGAVVTADAMFTHRDFCQRILDSGGDYLLPVEENQPTLRRDIQAVFAPLEGLSPPTARAR